MRVVTGELQVLHVGVILPIAAVSSATASASARRFSAVIAPGLAERGGLAPNYGAY